VFIIFPNRFVRVSLMGLTAILNHLWTRDEIEELKEKLKTSRK
jgi:hypothetical protein